MEREREEIVNKIESIVIIGDNLLLNIHHKYLDNLLNSTGVINNVKPYEIIYKDFSFSSFTINNGNNAKIVFENIKSEFYNNLNKIIEDFSGSIMKIGINFETQLESYCLNNILKIKNFNTQAVSFFVDNKDDNRRLTFNIFSLNSAQQTKTIVKTNIELNKQNNLNFDEECINKIDENITTVLEQLINGK